MKPDAKPAARRSLWAHLPIFAKLVLTVGLLVAALAVLLYSSLTQSAFVMQAAYAQESDYYNINSFQTTLLSADEYLQGYLHDPADGADDAALWQTAASQMRTQLARLKTDPDAVGVERYLLARAVTLGFVPYAARCETLLSMYAQGADTQALYAQYDRISSVASYLLQTTRALQSAALSDGQTALAELRVENEGRNHVFLLLSVAASLVVAALVSELVRSIVVPVLHLSEASKQISQGNFDTPDVQVNNRDEIYTLAQAFNGMKHRMKHLFETMRENSEMEQRLYQKDLEASESRRLLEAAKMQQLRNQINPHFLFNTLNIISRTARREKAAGTERLILALARLFRYSLKTDDVEVPLAREMKIVDDYIAIQSTRFENRVVLHWRVAADLDPTAVYVPAFVLQPIVENAVIHGLEPKISGGVLRIRAHVRAGQLHLIVSDNGVGMTREMRERLSVQQTVRGDVSGIGMGNVRSRLQMLAPGARFILHSAPGHGTSVHLIFPVKNAPRDAPPAWSAVRSENAADAGAPEPKPTAKEEPHAAT